MDGAEEIAPDPVRRMARILAVDLVTTELVSTLRDVGIRSILLKGPTVARWLYGEGEFRPYVDCDLLVSPTDRARVEALLEQTGYSPHGLSTIKGDWPRAARSWTKPETASVDLHQTFTGVGVDPTELWQILSQETEYMSIAGVDIEVLRLPARALIIALHAAKDGARVPQAMNDLRHALERVPEEVWSEAAVLAHRLHAEEAFAAGVGLLPEGEVLVERLSLSKTPTVAVSLRTQGGPPLAVGIDWFLNEHGWRRKTMLVIRKLVPPRRYVRAWSPMARRGRLGLVVAYIWRPVWVCMHIPPAIRAIRQARMRARSEATEAPGRTTAWGEVDGPGG